MGSNFKIVRKVDGIIVERLFGYDTYESAQWYADKMNAKLGRKEWYVVVA